MCRSGGVARWIVLFRWRRELFGEGSSGVLRWLGLGNLMLMVRRGANRDQLGVGGVLRDGDGRIIALFLGLLGVFDSNVVELRAIAFALDVLVAGRWEGVSSFIIESDSMVAISWILHKERRP
ncbi:hypothetical protein GQ457_11G025120 [Hibiscus cannabinus]